MPKKCPPGVICVENVTLVIFGILFLIVGYLVYTRNLSNNGNKRVKFNDQPTYNIYNSHNDDTVKSHYEVLMKPGTAHGNNPHDVFLNPYAPPMNSSHAIHSAAPPTHPPVPPGRMPINMATSVGSNVNSSYTQVGILSPGGGSDKILALMGRQLHTSRQKWQYYTISDQNNSVKLPIIKNGRSCTNEYGCDELMNGDSVYVEGYNKAFRVTVYENDSMQYIPYL
jgi:hypothetical protein